jgi:hypothetical protein
MSYAAEKGPGQDFTEEEIRRRLAACYRLLLDLARKHKSTATQDEGYESHSEVPGDELEGGCQEST